MFVTLENNDAHLVNVDLWQHKLNILIIYFSYFFIRFI